MKENTTMYDRLTIDVNDHVALLIAAVLSDSLPTLSIAEKPLPGSNVAGGD